MREGVGRFEDQRADDGAFGGGGGGGGHWPTAFLSKCCLETQSPHCLMQTIPTFGASADYGQNVALSMLYRYNVRSVFLPYRSEALLRTTSPTDCIWPQSKATLHQSIRLQAQPERDMLRDSDRLVERSCACIR
jgi:hypothetical protein